MTDGKRLRITVTHLDLHWRYSDYVYLTWEICNLNSLFSYDARLSSYSDAPVRLLNLLNSLFCFINVR